MKIEDMNLTATGKMALNKHIEKYGKKKGSEMFHKAIKSNLRGTKKWHDSTNKEVKISKYTQVLSGSV